MSVPWQALTHQPTFNASWMFQLTDGTVMVQDVSEPYWYRLTPDENGEYVNGTWTQLASSDNLGGSVPVYGPYSYAGAVLADGRVVVCGGEDNLKTSPANLSTCVIFDPTVNPNPTVSPPTGGWSLIASPPFPKGVYAADAPCCVLADGRLLIGAANGNATALLDPATLTWSPGPDNPGGNGEATWTLLPDGTVLCPCAASPPVVYKYVPAPNAQGMWIQDAEPPSDHTLPWVSSVGSEIGPAILLTNGTVIAFGSLGQNAVYVPPSSLKNQGTWKVSSQADFPDGKNSTADAPAVLLPNGKVLVMTGPTGVEDGNGYPVTPFLFDPGPPSMAKEPVPTSWVPKTPQSPKHPTEGDLAMLVLPNGQIMVTACNKDVQIYTPQDPTPVASAIPVISKGPTVAHPGELSIRLDGTLFNGLSQANSFGDDGNPATNFPLVRIKNKASGHVVYCRTHDHSTMGVATGSAPVHTYFDVPAKGKIELGASELYVVANGIPSAPWPIDIAASYGTLLAEVKSPNLPLPVGQTVSFTVRARDAVTNVTVEGDVLVDGVVVGKTDKAIMHTFQATAVTMKPAAQINTGSTGAHQIVPVGAPSGPGSEELFVTTTTYPKCTVRATGYYDATVDLGLEDTTMVTAKPI